MTYSIPELKKYLKMTQDALIRGWPSRNDLPKALEAIDETIKLLNNATITINIYQSENE